MIQADRLRFARELTGLARTQLAKKIGISVRRLQELETGKSDVSSSELSAIALHSGVPVAFFKTNVPAPSLTFEGTHFRALKSISQRQRARVRADGARIALFYEAIEGQGIQFPPDRLTDFIHQIADEVEFPEQLSDGEVENIAVRLRNYWNLGMGPIPHVIQLLESHGVAIFELGQNEVQGIDAFAVLTASERPAIFVGNNPCASRRRFSVAHELGHLVLNHASSDLEPGHPILEQQANRFAGAFLMPAPLYRASMHNRTTVFDLLEAKPVWRVSIAAMLVRSHQLGLLDYHDRAVGFRQLNAHWGRHEPKEPSLERPVALQRALSLLGEAMIETIASECGMSYAYLQDIQDHNAKDEEMSRHKEYKHNVVPLHNQL